MKKITLALSGLLLIQITHAQVSKGSIFTGGSVGITSSKSETSINSNGSGKSSSWILSPQFGIAIKENKIIGIQLNVQQSSNENNNGLGGLSKNSSQAYGVGFFYRQYFPIHAKWMLFGQATLSAGFGNNEISSFGIKTNKGSNWNTQLGITPGITYNVGKKVWLEASLGNLLSIGYNAQKDDVLNVSGTVASSSSNNTFSANANVNPVNNINIGIRWIIPKS